MPTKKKIAETMEEMGVSLSEARFILAIEQGRVRSDYIVKDQNGATADDERAAWWENDPRFTNVAAKTPDCPKATGVASGGVVRRDGKTKNASRTLTVKPAPKTLS